MTDYHYQATARDDPPEDEGVVPHAGATPRRSAYPPEDEAYWAEAGAPPAVEEEPLWYEDRVRAAETVRTPSSVVAPGHDRTHRLPAAHWTEPEAPLAEGDAAEEPTAWRYEAEETPETGVWRDETLDEIVPPEAEASGPLAIAWEAEPDADDGEREVYVPGATAAAGLAAAESGDRRIRFDPTKERGAAFYDNAARHSRRVRLLKIALPAVAVLAVAGFFVVLSRDHGDDDGLPALTLGGINVESRQITMDKPHISGFDGTRRAYEVRAVKATQDLGNPKVVTLEQIEARFAIGDDVRANIDAVTGTYDGNTQKMTLKGGISLTTTNGYAAELEDADIDVEKGTVSSDTGVLIRGKEGILTADSIEVLDRGKHIFFRGDVKIVYQPPETEEGSTTGGEAETPTAASPPTIEEAPDGST